MVILPIPLMHALPLFRTPYTPTMFRKYKPEGFHMIRPSSSDFSSDVSSSSDCVLGVALTIGQWDCIKICRCAASTWLMSYIKRMQKPNPSWFLRISLFAMGR